MGTHILESGYWARAAKERDELVDTLDTKAGQMKGGNTTPMAWEKRERGGLYYTRSKKVNGRVIREYVGGGALGEVSARMDAAERRHREEKAALWREERERLEALDGLAEELYEAGEVLAKAALLASGYHQHKRGEWRKRRGARNPKE